MSPLTATANNSTKMLNQQHFKFRNRSLIAISALDLEIAKFTATTSGFLAIDTRLVTNDGMTPSEFEVQALNLIGKLAGLYQF